MEQHSYELNAHQAVHGLAGVVNFHCDDCGVRIFIGGLPHSTVMDLAVMLGLWHEGKLLSEGANR